MPGSAAGVCRAIDARDEMLAFALDYHGESRDLALVSYFRSGLAAFDALRQLLEWRFGSLERVGRVLDFASGFGRMTRFLVTALPADRVWVSEIQAGAARFQKRWLGVGVVPAAAAPEAFACERRFSAIFAASFFSHLPQPAFRTWLERLWSRVEPGGFLAFSTHGEEVMLPGRTMPASGFYFEEMSESDALDKSSYGSSWASEGFVRRTAEETLGGDIVVHRLARGLWHFQDLYVVTEAGGDPAAGPLLRRGPEGYVEACRQDPAGPLELEGWAIDHDRPTEPLSLEVDLDGDRIAAGPADRLRLDLVERFGDPAYGRSGWRFTLPLSAARRPSALLTVRSSSSSGRPWVLFVGSLGAAVGAARAARLRIDLEAARKVVAETSERLSDVSTRLGWAEFQLASRGWEIKGLEARIAAMEASRFWRLREAWFAVKRRLGWREKAAIAAPATDRGPDRPAG